MTYVQTAKAEIEIDLGAIFPLTMQSGITQAFVEENGRKLVQCYLDLVECQFENGNKHIDWVWFKETFIEGWMFCHSGQENRLAMAVIESGLVDFQEIVEYLDDAFKLSIVRMDADADAATIEVISRNAEIVARVYVEGDNTLAQPVKAQHIGGKLFKLHKHLLDIIGTIG